ncbi:hypothetical protein M405DRAFT_311223, partial [Rhizopogon salebrosus TDB-379]
LIPSRPKTMTPCSRGKGDVPRARDNFPTERQYLVTRERPLPSSRHLTRLHRC